MGKNLGFIEKIVLVDGTILENVEVLFNSPIPTGEQIESMLVPANEESKKLFGTADDKWSALLNKEIRVDDLSNTPFKKIVSDGRTTIDLGELITEMTTDELAAGMTVKVGDTIYTGTRKDD